MNHNIEIINKNVAALKFSLIPFIKEIEYTPDNYFPEYEEPIRITDIGLIILNKDYEQYELLKDIMIKVMKKSDRQIKKYLELNMDLKQTDNIKIFYLFAYNTELERRQKRKEVRL